MAAWRVAKSLLHLREQVDQLAPHRSKSDDGTIGDARHSARASDHNPLNGVVHAMDITHDPHGGFDSYAFAESLRQNRDKRVKYVISNHRIWAPTIAPNWRPYSGSNPHDRHVHVSVVAPAKLADDIGDWNFVLAPPDLSIPARANRAVLRLGSKGDDVGYLQTLLDLPVDNIFGLKVDKAVRKFQAEHGLQVDGIVGSYTWDALITQQAAQAPQAVAPPLNNVMPVPPVAVASLPVPALPVPSEPQDPLVDQAPSLLAPVYSYGKGSWYSQYHGKYVWIDTGDAPNSSALGVPDSCQGVSFMNSHTLGHWYEVIAPNGVSSIEQQTDIGPHPRTGRKIDISAAAAERFGYSPRKFPTDQIFKWRAVPPPASVAALPPRRQAVAYYAERRPTEIV